MDIPRSVRSRLSPNDNAPSPYSNARDILKPIAMIENNGINKKQGKRKSTVDNIADHLVDTFNSLQSRQFYCKVAWKLDAPTIDKLVSIAKADATRSPGGLFNILARREMGEI